MLATFFIELLSALYVLLRYGTATVYRLSMLILVYLAVFQLAEWNVCEGLLLGLSAITWSKIGYVAITLLPALGFHLAVRIAGRGRFWHILMPYITALGFITGFLFVEHGLQGSACLGNYVIFRIEPRLVSWYTLYYYGMLTISVLYSYRMRIHVSPYMRRALTGLMVGYLAFIIPTTAVTAINPGVIHGVPSIMCGFAVLLALCLVGWVIPMYHKGLLHSKSKR